MCGAPVSPPGRPRYGRARVIRATSQIPEVATPMNVTVVFAITALLTAVSSKLLFNFHRPNLVVVEVAGLVAA